MTDDLFKEKFKEISKELKKALNWEIDHRCPNCEHKNREDAFKALEITASLDRWNCPDCGIEGKGAYQDVPENGDMVTWSEPNFRELVKPFQLNFLDGYLYAL